MVISWNGDALAWASKRQALTAYSTCEAELEAMASTAQELLHASELVHALTGKCLKLEMKADNASAVTLVVRSRFIAHAWRTRHFAIRASWLRDVAASKDIQVEHVAGASLVADMLTKSLQKGRLALLRPMLGLESLM